MTIKEAQEKRMSDYEKGLAAIVGGFGFGAAFIYWAVPALVDLIIYLGA